MTDYMKEAERLSRVLEDIAQTALRGVDNEQIRGHLMDASALLAHFQRGAPDGWKEATIAWEVCASIHREYAKKKDPFFSTRQADFVRHTEAARAALLATTPDQFRDATKMVAEPADPDPLHLSRILHELAGAASLCWEPRPTGVFDSQLAIQFVEQALAEIRSRMTSAPAEVPMPQGYVERPSDYTGDIWIESQMRTYGAACRAAGEAAGYARGVRGERDECAALCRNIYSWPGAYYAGPMDTATLKAAASAIEARSGPKVGKRAALRGEVKP